MKNFVDFLEKIGKNDNRTYMNKISCNYLRETECESVSLFA